MTPRTHKKRIWGIPVTLRTREGASSPEGAVVAALLLYKAGNLLNFLTIMAVIIALSCYAPNGFITAGVVLATVALSWFRKVGIWMHDIYWDDCLANGDITSAMDLLVGGKHHIRRRYLRKLHALMFHTPRETLSHRGRDIHAKLGREIALHDVVIPTWILLTVAENAKHVREILVKSIK